MRIQNLTLEKYFIKYNTYKTIMTKILGIMLITILFTFTSSYGAGKEIKTVTIKCTEMTCEGCKREITRSIKLLDGIDKIDVNLDTKIITVTFDDKKATETDLIKAIENAGYASEVVK
ncbi:MAG: copper chaperone [Ignavibacteriae bacterium]|nr:MAG: copper chaperone [Ignavibacteriota bacterium]